MRRFWISWNEYSEDWRPITDPPTRAIIGWWKSGEAGDGSYATLCAVVDAASEGAAKKAVKKNWPPERMPPVWRFCEEKPADFMPGGRFPAKVDR